MYVYMYVRICTYIYIYTCCMRQDEGRMVRSFQRTFNLPLDADTSKIKVTYTTADGQLSVDVPSKAIYMYTYNMYIYICIHGYIYIYVYMYVCTVYVRIYMAVSHWYDRKEISNWELHGLARGVLHQMPGLGDIRAPPIWGPNLGPRGPQGPGP